MIQALLHAPIESPAAVIQDLKAYGHTDHEIAEACGVVQTTITRIRHGQHDPRWTLAVKLLLLREAVRQAPRGAAV
jgi:predicted transcriptional regulator